MNHLRRSVLALLVLVTFFFNIERLDLDEMGPAIDLQTFVYILGFVAIVFTLAIPLLRRVPTSLSLLAWTGLYLLGKLVFFHRDDRPLVGDLHTFISLLELSFIYASVLLTRQVADDLYDFERTIENITFPDPERRLRNMSDALQDIRTELVRSRRHHHVLSVIVAEINPESIKINLHRTVQQVQRAMMARYVNTSAARLIVDAVRRTDILVEQGDNGRFVIVCPETDNQGSKILAERIQTLAAGRLGIQVACGISSFPAEGTTFDKLVHQAGLRVNSPALEVPSSIPVEIESEEPCDTRATPLETAGRSDREK